MASSHINTVCPLRWATGVKSPNMALVVFPDSILLKWLVLEEVDSGIASCQASFTSAQKFTGPCRKWVDVEDQPFIFTTRQGENRKRATSQQSAWLSGAETVEVTESLVFGAWESVFWRNSLLSSSKTAKCLSAS